MSRDELMDYIIELDEENGRYERKLIKLQSNWNSLREYYKRKVEETKNSTALYDKWTRYSSVLSKMNELERNDK